MQKQSGFEQAQELFRLWLWSRQMDMEYLQDLVQSQAQAQYRQMLLGLEQALALFQHQGLPMHQQSEKD